MLAKQQHVPVFLPVCLPVFVSVCLRVYLPVCVVYMLVCACLTRGRGPAALSSVCLSVCLVYIHVVCAWLTGGRGLFAGPAALSCVYLSCLHTRGMCLAYRRKRSICWQSSTQLCLSVLSTYMWYVLGLQEEEVYLLAEQQQSLACLSACLTLRLCCLYMWYVCLVCIWYVICARLTGGRIVCLSGLYVYAWSICGMSVWSISDMSVWSICGMSVWSICGM